MFRPLWRIPREELAQLDGCAPARLARSQSLCVEPMSADLPRGSALKCQLTPLGKKPTKRREINKNISNSQKRVGSGSNDASCHRLELPDLRFDTIASMAAKFRFKHNPEEALLVQCQPTPVVSLSCNKLLAGFSFSA
jgi:hypothetical protein